MEVWDVRQDDPIPDDEGPCCHECGDPLVEPEDIEEGIHFLCDVDGGEYLTPEDFDEGGESG